MNKVFLKGNVFGNTVRFIETNGKEVMIFNLTFSLGKDKKFAYIKCICFGEVAKKINTKVCKNPDRMYKVFVEGKLSQEEYDGKKNFFIVANVVNII